MGEGSPAYRGEATAVWRGLRSGSPPRKNGSSARVLTMTAAADLIRAIVHNRVDNQVRGASLANHRHRRSDRSEPFYLLSRVAARPVAPAQPHRRHFADRAAAHRAGLGSATCSRREERRG